MAEYWLREANQWRSLKNGTTVPVDDEPPIADMYVGMHNSPVGEAQWLVTKAEWGGARSGIRRSYSTNLPSSAPSVLTDCYGKRASWHSVKADWVQMASGSLDGTVTSFLNSIPADHELMLTFAHEPENDNPLAQEVDRSAEWRAAQEHFYDLVKSVRPQTLVGPILMGYTFVPASGRVPSRWAPSASKMDFFAIDTYQAYRFPAAGNGTTWHNWPVPGVTAWREMCATLGVPGAIGETACAEDESGIGPTRKVGWMQAAVADSIAHGDIAFCWFNSYKPGDTAESMLLNSSSESLAAWANILNANQKGVKG